jgi:hypothetical protein
MTHNKCLDLSPYLIYGQSLCQSQAEADTLFPRTVMLLSKAGAVSFSSALTSRFVRISFYASTPPPPQSWFGLYENRITAAEITFVRTADYTRLDYKKNLDVMQVLNTQPIMEFIGNNEGNCKILFLLIPRSRIPFQIFRYQAKGRRSLDIRRWHVTVKDCLA